MELTFQRIAKTSPYLRTVRALYKEAFPRNERMSLRKLKKAASSEMVDWLAVFDGETFVGFTYTAFNEEIAYLFYFAVAQGLRSKGYGACILGGLQTRYTVPLALDIESTKIGASDPMRKRRKAFYLRNGFSEAGFGANYYGVEYETLCCGGAVAKGQLKRLFDTYIQKALKRRASK